MEVIGIIAGLCITVWMLHGLFPKQYDALCRKIDAWGDKGDK